MSKDINKMNLDVNKELVSIQAHFNTKKSEPYNFENIYNSIEDNKIGKIINTVSSYISSGPVGSSKNYRLEYYEFYVKFIITILTTHPRKYSINKAYLKLNFLEILTRLMKGNEYLKKIEPFIIDNFKELNKILGILCQGVQG